MKTVPAVDVRVPYGRRLFAFVLISVVFFPDLHYNLIARKDKSVFIPAVVYVVVVVVVVV